MIVERSTDRSPVIPCHRSTGPVNKANVRHGAVDGTTFFKFLYNGKRR